MSGPVLILAGGTGGHIFPGLALASALRARGVPVAWLGASGGLESRLVPEAGIDFQGVAIGGVRGKGLRTLLLAPIRLLRALWHALAIVRTLAPRSVISFGGYAAGPGGLAAWLSRRPLLVHEQNRVPGMTNRLLARVARRVLVGFPDAFPPATGAIAVGNPVRAEIAALPPPEQRFAGRDGPVRLLVLGGSQGARMLNRAIPALLAELRHRHRVEVRHQTGANLLHDARASYAAAFAASPLVHDAVRIEPFIADMAEAYGWADLVICRAGALTLAELCAAGVGSVLVPFPFAVDDHQTRNAEFLVACGGAYLLPESDGLASELGSLLDGVISERARLLAMARSARAKAQPDAAQRIADRCLAEAAA